VNTPTPAPTIVGQSVPDCGRVGTAGVAEGPGVPLQVQLTLVVHDGFLQKPLEQIKPDEQLLLVPQVPLQLLGVPVGVVLGVGVTTGVPVGVAVGVPDGVPVGVGVGVFKAKVKERVQDAGGVISAALGILEGTFGATGT